MEKEYNKYLWSPKQPRVYGISPLTISGTPMSEEDVSASLQAKNLQQELQQNPIFKSAKQQVAQQEQREEEIAASKKWLELHPEDSNDDSYTIFERGKHQAIVDGRDPSYYEKMIDDGKQFTKDALGVLSFPYLGAASAGAYGYGASLGAKGLFAGQGIYGLANKDGIRKTANLIKSSDYGKAALSGAGDALNAVIILPGAKFLRNAAKYGLKSTVAGDMLRQNVRNTALATLEPILNVGWGPKQTIKVSRAGKYNQMYFPERWDAVNEGANPHGVWLQGKYGTPRTDLTNPGKGAKAARARNVFSTRPDKYTGTVTLDKPMITVGEVPNRSLLSYQADNMGADGLIYNGVYDNGYNNNQVILSFKKPNLNKIKLSEEERLGTPKVERNNIDNAVGRARAGNDRRRLKFLREIHFKEASPNNTIIDDNGNPIKVYHGSPSKFTVFDYERQAQYPDGHFFFSQDPSYAKLVGTWHSSPYERANVREFYLYDTEKYPLNKFKVWNEDDSRRFLEMSELDSDIANYIMIRYQKTPHTIYGYDAGRSFTPGSYDYAVPYNTQMKLTNPIVFDDKGHFIKLSKRDNFNNPDIRYKQGGILKK